MYDCDCFVVCFLSGRSGSFQPRLTHLSSLVDGLQSQAKTKMQDFGPWVDGCWWVNCHTNVLSVYINHTCQCTCLCVSASCLCVHVHAHTACVSLRAWEGDWRWFFVNFLKRLQHSVFYWSWMSRWRRSKWSVLLSEDFTFLVFLLWNVSFAINISISIDYNIKFVKVLFQSTQ